MTSFASYQKSALVDGEGQPDHAERAASTGDRDESVRCRGGDEIGAGGASGNGGNSTPGVDVDLAHFAQVDHQGVVADGPANPIVPATADRCIE